MMTPILRQTNRALDVSEIWRGALVAAILFEITTYVFPFYVGHFMSHAWFGSALLFFGILAFWFWLIALVVVVGAELNSFVALGQGPWETDLAGLVAGVARHDPAPHQVEGKAIWSGSAPRPPWRPAPRVIARP